MTIKTVRNLRRVSQVLFFIVFCWLILKTSFPVDFSTAPQKEITLPYPVSIALEFDPLVALSVLLTSGTIYKGLLWSLVILIPTIFIGRFFCGWVCPLGSLNQWISEIPSERLKRKGAGKIDSNRYRPYQRIKYYILLFFLGAAITGVLQIGILDPLCLLARSIGTGILPMLHVSADAVLGWFKDIGYPPLISMVQYVYDIFASLFLTYRQVHFHAVISLVFFFFIILLLNQLFTRFWCRAICPLGALLGLFSRFAIFGLQKDESVCEGCNICLLACQGGDNPHIGAKWHQAECHICLNCQASCPNGALRFTFFPNQHTTTTNPAGTSKVDITRRKAAASVIGGVALAALYRAGDAFAVNSNPYLIRPPGSQPEHDFLARCIRCGQCMRVCPNNALHPTLLEAGLEGLWSPILIPKIGYCEPTCTLCGQVCPTGAIREMSVQDKVGTDEIPPDRIGTACIDRGRCLPWAMAIPCIVCEEWCPTSPKAVYLREEKTFDRDGVEVTVQRPYIDPDLCTGCGACEFACPVADKRAIYVTSVGETRSRENQILLERKRR